MADQTLTLTDDERRIIRHALTVRIKDFVAQEQDMDVFRATGVRPAMRSRPSLDAMFVLLDKVKAPGL